jgi:serine/threonine-protein kinase
MSPEQIKNAKHADLRTDIWALGAILYELVTGEPPFGGETSGEVFAAVLEAAPVPMEARARETPPELAAIVMRCLSRDRDARYAGAGELSLALAPFGTGEVAPTRAIVPRARGAESSRNIAAPTVAEAELLNTAAAAAWTTGHSRKVRRTRWAIAGGAAVLAALAIVGIAVGRAGARSGGTTTAAPPSVAPAIASTIPALDPSAVAFTAVTSASAEPEAPAASSAKARPPAPLKGAKAPVGPRTSPLQKTEPKKSASDILKDSY